MKLAMTVQAENKNRPRVAHNRESSTKNDDSRRVIGGAAAAGRQAKTQTKVNYFVRNGDLAMNPEQRLYREY